MFMFFEKYIFVSLKKLGQRDVCHCGGLSFHLETRETSTWTLLLLKRALIYCICAECGMASS